MVMAMPSPVPPEAPDADALPAAPLRVTRAETAPDGAVEDCVPLVQTYVSLVEADADAGVSEARPQA